MWGSLLGPDRLEAHWPPYGEPLSRALSAIAGNHVDLVRVLSGKVHPQEVPSQQYRSWLDPNNSIAIAVVQYAHREACRIGSGDNRNPNFQELAGVERP